MSNVFENKGATATTIVVAASDSLNKGAGNYICSGAADDVEIQAALNAAAGGEVILLEGNYVTSQNLTVPDDTCLRGQGFDTVITPTGAAIGGAQNGAVELGNRSILRDMKIILAAGAGAGTTRPNVVMADTKTQIWVEDVWIVGDTSVADDGSVLRQCGILFDTVTDSKVVNCRVEDNDRHGIALKTSLNNTITGNTCQGNTLIGIFLYPNSNDNTITGNTVQGNTDGIYVAGSSNNNTVTGNICQGNAGYGIVLQTNCENNTITGNTVQGNTGNLGAITVDASNNNTVTGNTVQGNTGHGIYIYNGSVNNTVTGNTCADNGQHGIYLNASDENVVTGNQCDDNGAGGTYHGIYVRRSSYCTVTGNVCNNNLIDGINVTGDATTNADYNSVTGNVCYGNGDDGIEIAGGADANKNVVTGNQLLGNTGTALVDGGTNTDVGHNITV